jgi:GlpG protein
MSTSEPLRICSKCKRPLPEFGEVFAYCPYCGTPATEPLERGGIPEAPLGQGGSNKVGASVVAPALPSRPEAGDSEWICSDCEKSLGEHGEAFDYCPHCGASLADVDDAEEIPEVPDVPSALGEPREVTQPPRSEPSQSASAKESPRLWATWAICAACAVIFLGLAAESTPNTWDALAKWGAPPSNKVWEGAYWGLLTSTLVHQALWHLIFNLYWLWVLGACLERAIGSIPYLLLILGAAVVSSGCQLAACGSTGIGASGVAYAMFGFMLVARNRFPAFREVLSAQTIKLFLFWLVGCMLATYMGVWQVGNAAHLCGMLFGAVSAGCFVLKYKRPLLFPALAGLGIASIVPLFWCPWSVTWLGLQGIRANEAGRTQRAIGYYSRAIDLDPSAAWVYYNRGISYLAAGDPKDAQADFATASRLDPKLPTPEEEHADAHQPHDRASPSQPGG